MWQLFKLASTVLRITKGTDPCGLSGLMVSAVPCPFSASLGGWWVTEIGGHCWSGGETFTAPLQAGSPLTQWPNIDDAALAPGFLSTFKAFLKAQVLLLNHVQY